MSTIVTPQAHSQLSLHQKAQPPPPLFFLAAFLLFTSAFTVASIIVRTRTTTVNPSALNSRPNEAISQACDRTFYPNLCVSSPVAFLVALVASEHEELLGDIHGVEDEQGVCRDPDREPLCMTSLEDKDELQRQPPSVVTRLMGLDVLLGEASR